MATASDPSLSRHGHELIGNIEVLSSHGCGNEERLGLTSVQSNTEHNSHNHNNNNNNNNNIKTYRPPIVESTTDNICHKEMIVAGRQHSMGLPRSRPDTPQVPKEARTPLVIHGRHGGTGTPDPSTAEGGKQELGHAITTDRDRNPCTDTHVRASYHFTRPSVPIPHIRGREVTANVLRPQGVPTSTGNILQDLQPGSDADSISSNEPNSLNTSGTSGSSMNTSQTVSSLNTSQTVSSLNTSQTASSLNTSQTASSLNTSRSSESSTDSASSSEGNGHKAEPLTFGDPRQRQVFEALTGIQNLRRSGDFSDITIRVKGVDFRCHRFVLANCSQFFGDLLNGDQPEKPEGPTDKEASPIRAVDQDESNRKDDKIDGNNCDSSDHNNSNNTNDNHPDSGEMTKTIRPVSAEQSKLTNGNPVIVLTGVEPHVFDKVLDFMYCVFDDVITDSTALQLLLAANTFKLSNLCQTCVAHIAHTVSVNNVYDVISLVDSGCPGLSDHKVKIRCHQVFRENFLQLSCKDEFLGLGRTRMICLVADSMLVIQNEIDLIQPLIRWVEVRPSERCADLTLMLQLIRFPLMSSVDMDKLLDMPFLRENSLAKALIEESRTYSLNDFPDRMAWPRQNCISRCHFPSRDFILWTADRDKGLHLYSIIDGLHYKVTTFNEATMDKLGFTFDSTSTVCCYGDRLFFTGGEFKTDLAWSIDTGTGEVSVHSKMPRGRKAHSMVVSRGCVYCLGGQDKRGYTVLDSVDAYVISKDLWVKVGHMAVAAYNMTAVVSGGAIYMIGGVDHAGQPLRVVQCFAVLRSGLYSAFKVDISNMPPSLMSPRAITSGMEGAIYIVCGHGEVYRLDVDKRCLHHINTLKSLNKNPRFRFGLAHVGGCLVVNGGHQLGHNKQEPVRSVCMDIATKAEVKDYSPLLPADIINTCFYAKLSSGILGYSKLSTPGH